MSGGAHICQGLCAGLPRGLPGGLSPGLLGPLESRLAASLSARAPAVPAEWPRPSCKPAAFEEGGVVTGGTVNIYGLMFFLLDLPDAQKNNLCSQMHK